MKSGCNVVDQVGEMKIEGNLVPHLWYKKITFSSGKAHFVAITLLADILYWYRPTLVRDESGDVIGTRTKFKGTQGQVPCPKSKMIGTRDLSPRPMARIRPYIRLFLWGSSDLKVSWNKKNGWLHIGESN
jgi:hypothetical protein